LRPAKITGEKRRSETEKEAKIKAYKSGTEAS
jgi:hypothetical protein